MLVIRGGGRAAGVGVAPYSVQSQPPGLASGGGGDTGAEEIESSGQEPSTSTGQTASGENVKHSDCDSDSTNTNVLFLLQGVVPGYVCDFQEEVAL